MPNPGLLHPELLPLRRSTADPYLHRRHSNTVLAQFVCVLVCTRFVCALQVSASPVLCKFWYLYGGVNGDLLQEGLCHAQVYCTQSPCPYGSPLLTCTSTGDTQAQIWLSLCGLGMHFVPFPGLSGSGDHVLGECTLPGGPCILITYLAPAA